MKCWYRELFRGNSKSDVREAYIHLIKDNLSIMHALPNGRINLSDILVLCRCNIVIDGDCMRADGLEFLNLEHGAEPSDIYRQRCVEIVFIKPEDVP